MDFSDRPLFSPFRRLTSSGTSDWRSLAYEIRSYTLRFFQRTLLDQDTPLAQDVAGKPGSAVFTEWRPGVEPPPVFFNGSLQSCGISYPDKTSLVQKIH